MTHNAESVAGNWLIERGKRAEVRLQAMDPTTLGPAGKLLLGIRKQTCPTCSGKGYVEVTQIDGNEESV